MSDDYDTTPDRRIVALEAVMLDCCLPCYFQGSSAPVVLAVPVWPGMSYSDAHEECLNEWHCDTSEAFAFVGADEMGQRAITEMFGALAESDDVADFAPDVEIDPETDEPYENDDGESCFLYVALRPVFDDEDEDFITEDEEG